MVRGDISLWENVPKEIQKMSGLADGLTISCIRVAFSYEAQIDTVDHCTSQTKTDPEEFTQSVARKEQDLCKTKLCFYTPRLSRGQQTLMGFLVDGVIRMSGRTP